jgi:hypothetical protein
LIILIATNHQPSPAENHCFIRSPFLLVPLWTSLLTLRASAQRRTLIYHNLLGGHPGDRSNVRAPMSHYSSAAATEPFVRRHKGTPLKSEKTMMITTPSQAIIIIITTPSLISDYR